LKNRETLIQILLILRSNGIINKKILLAVEKLPPHYYLNLLGLYKNFKQINVNELIRLLKILQNVLDHKPKLDNVFITDIKKGWLVVLASFLGKRIYGLCPNREIKEKIESILSFLKISNVFLKVSTINSNWNLVAPFDLIIDFKRCEILPLKFLELLTNEGLLFFTKVIKKKVIIVKCNKRKNSEVFNKSEFFLEDNIIL